MKITAEVGESGGRQNGKKPGPFTWVKEVRSKYVGPAAGVSGTTRKRLLIILCTYVDSATGRGCTKVRTLAGDTQMDRVTVWRAMRSFEAEGLLRWEEDGWFTLDLDALGRLPTWKEVLHPATREKAENSRSHVAPRNNALHHATDDVAHRNAHVAPRNTLLEVEPSSEPSSELSMEPSIKIDLGTQNSLAQPGAVQPSETTSVGEDVSGCPQPRRGEGQSQDFAGDEGGDRGRTQGFADRVRVAEIDTVCPYCGYAIEVGDDIAPPPVGHEWWGPRKSAWLHVECAPAVYDGHGAGAHGPEEPDVVVTDAHYADCTCADCIPVVDDDFADCLCGDCQFGECTCGECSCGMVLDDPAAPEPPPEVPVSGEKRQEGIAYLDGWRAAPSTIEGSTAVNW